MDRSGTSTLARHPAISVMTPIMTKERFAELTGLEVGVVRGMLDRGHLPSAKFGRHRFVNVALLFLRCLADEDAPGVGEEPSFYGRC